VSTFTHLARVLGHRPVVRLGATSGVQRRGKVLVQYKTDNFDFRRLRRSNWHSNVWESARIAWILREMGFDVDLIDRAYRGPPPEAKYLVYLGLGSGGSGKSFAEWAARSQASHRVLLATGARPDIARRNALAQQRQFNERYGVSTTPMRYAESFDLHSVLQAATAILSIGESSEFGPRSWAGIGMEVHTYLPGVYRSTGVKVPSRRSRSANSYLCFAGNGFVHKGVDQIVEAFLANPSLELDICGPPTDRDFFTALGSRIEAARNVRYHGFVPFRSRHYANLASRATFSILASCSEGCSTSVAATMSSGLIPVVTEESGISPGTFGFRIDSPLPNRVGAIQKAVEECSLLTKRDLVERSTASLIDSRKYTRESFDTSMRLALTALLGDMGQGD
jgi:glycosyltransferase involved in cell wall biosynthesis